MSKFYQVPVVAQPSSMTCWHASAQMIWYYWQGVTKRQGPMNTLAGNYSANNGVTPAEFISLAGKAGLEEVTPIQSNYSAPMIEDLLTKHGPLWCAGYWFNAPHIVVLTGIDDQQTIYFNDPDLGVKKTGAVSWFNLKLASQFAGCLMHKNPQAY